VLGVVRNEEHLGDVLVMGISNYHH
jgi:hypothetical protein